MKKRFYTVNLIILGLILAVSAFSMWFGKREAYSESERRALALPPSFSADNVLSGKYASEFNDFTEDQIPLRESLRSLKALASKYLLQQRDNNGFYYCRGQLSQLSYPLDNQQVAHAVGRFQNVYELCLQREGIRPLFCIVPDKNYYLAAQNGYPALDYEALFSQMRGGLPFCDFCDITDLLSPDSYYSTDSHWRQEKILPVAERLLDELGGDEIVNFSTEEQSIPFYGVYYSQAALPIAPDTIKLMMSGLENEYRVIYYSDGSPREGELYSMEKLEGRDGYEVYLSGTQPLIRIENPSGKGKLIIFRDSFASSLVPLLAPSFESVTLVDIRYMEPSILKEYVSFEDAEVLFLYSTLILNNSLSLR